MYLILMKFSLLITIQFFDGYVSKGKIERIIMRRMEKSAKWWIRSRLEAAFVDWIKDQNFKERNLLPHSIPSPYSSLSTTCNVFINWHDMTWHDTRGQEKEEQGIKDQCWGKGEKERWAKQGFLIVELSSFASPCKSSSSLLHLQVCEHLSILSLHRNPGAPERHETWIHALPPFFYKEGKERNSTCMMRIGW